MVQKVEEIKKVEEMKKLEERNWGRGEEGRETQALVRSDLPLALHDGSRGAEGRWGNMAKGVSRGIF